MYVKLRNTELTQLSCFIKDINHVFINITEERMGRHCVIFFEHSCIWCNVLLQVIMG